jgi:FkbM family methyltransferase
MRALSAIAHVIRRACVTPLALVRELGNSVRIAADARSAARIGTDAVLYRLMRLVRPPRADAVRRVRLRPSVEVAYRLNRGDYLVVRELWMDEAYRLPFPLEPRTMIDLGANIGLTCLWLSLSYPLTTIVAVEPLASNVRLLRDNLARNRIDATVIEAAVGPEDGVTGFKPNRDFTAGRIDLSGEPVSVVSMPTLLARLPPSTLVDLLKIDIEGAEQQLLSGDLGWLDRVRSIIIEFHLDRVDRDALVERIERHGLRYLPAGSVHRHSMDAFVRVEEPGVT